MFLFSYLQTYDDTTGSSESLVRNEVIKFLKLDALNFNFLSQTNHPKAKEWMLAAARANYQELAKLASEHPQLVKLQVSPAIDN